MYNGPGLNHELRYTGYGMKSYQLITNVSSNLICSDG